MISPKVKGTLASLVLLLIYFSVVSLVSGWNFMLEQFSRYWYFVVTLAAGFGIQFGLYSYLKDAMKRKHTASGKVLAVSGTTSTAAMISCCAHYLINFLPVLAGIGIITVISQYQIQLFWVGIAFNIAGITYMLYQVKKFTASL
jgi:Cu+-exporting ATPase